MNLLAFGILLNTIIRSVKRRRVVSFTCKNGEVWSAFVHKIFLQSESHRNAAISNDTWTKLTKILLSFGKVHRISEHGLIRKIILLVFFQNYLFQSPRTRSFSNFDIVVILMLNYLNTKQWFRLVLFFVLFWFFGGFGSKQCNEMFFSYFSTHRVTNIDLACLFSVLRTAPVIIHHTKKKN